MPAANTTTLRCAARGTGQISWLREQIDPALTRSALLTTILDYACSPSGLRALRDYRASQIRGDRS